MMYGYTFCFIGSELNGSYFYFPFMFLIVTALIVNIVIAPYELGRLLSLVITIILLVTIYVYDFLFYTTTKQKEIFYIPMFLEAILLFGGWLLYRFRVPEGLCKSVKFFQLYTTGFIFFSLLLINFYYEASNILYDTLKYNAGNFDINTDNWYHMS